MVLQALLPPGIMTGMHLYPAMDLREGRCVRLSQGRFDLLTEYSGDPVAMALDLAARGARTLHVVDLDGAKEGRPVQLGLVERIARALDIPVQLGGGLRRDEDVTAALEAGAARVVVGSALARDPEMGRRLTAKHGERVGAAVDALDGQVRTHGWQESSGLDASVLVGRLQRAGVKWFLCTEIACDGMLSGPALEWYRRLRAEHPEAELLASGGVSSLEDLKSLRRLGMDGAVVGKALYEGRFGLSEALDACR